MGGRGKDDTLGTLGTTATASPETATPAAKKRVRIADTNERSVKKDRKEDRRRVRDGDSGGQRRKKQRGRDSRINRSEKRIRQRLMSSSGSGEDEDGCAAEATAEICAESARVCGRTQCRLKRVVCRDLSKRVVDLEQQLDSSVRRTEELDQQVWELTDTDGYAQWMERKEQWLRTVEVKRAGWLMERRKVHMERELWRIGRQLEKAEERLSIVHQQAAAAAGSLVGAERSLSAERYEEAAMRAKMTEMTTQLVEMHSLAERLQAEASAEMMEGRSRKEWRQEIERDRVEVAAAWQMVEREQVQELVGDRVEIGQSGLSRLAAEAKDQEVMRCRVMGGGWSHFNVKDAPIKYFSTQRDIRSGQNDSRLVELRRESRGLVVDGAGEVQVRPVQKFYSVCQLRGAEREALSKAEVMVVTDKIDGEMMCGVVREGQVELWSRGGWTEQARSATRWAHDSKMGILALVAAVWQLGGTATFEYVGRQSRVKVRYVETDLVLVAVRGRESGVWWQYDELQGLGLQYGVTVVRRRRELEGLGLAEVDDAVSGWEGSEGVVVQLTNGVVLKFKSWWWRQCEKKQKRRWYRPESKLQAVRREKQRRAHLEKEDLRVVLRGWNHWVHPSRGFQEFSQAMKVEALYRRSDGRQGVVVVSFKTAEAAKAALGCRRLMGSRVQAVRAYSSRMTPTEEYRVKTWWR